MLHRLRPRPSLLVQNQAPKEGCKIFKAKGSFGENADMSTVRIHGQTTLAKTFQTHSRLNIALKTQSMGAKSGGGLCGL